MSGHGMSGHGMSRRSLIAVAAVAVVVVAAAAIIVALRGSGSDPSSPAADPAATATMPAAPAAYIGVFTRPSPQSYAGVSKFTATTGVRPSIVVYYSAWNEPFRRYFAEEAARHHAVPLVQIDPTGISLPAIADGHYDAFLRSYARSVRSFGSRVIISFGHEMNGHWYSWAFRHASAREFVAAWRHIVDVFRAAGATNVTWQWTVNVIARRRGIPSPAAWWPGRQYVNWVGIDGYYLKPSWRFAPLFGPTIKDIRTLTLDPVLISETGVAPAAGKAAKIADLFRGVRAYGLLGLVWFDVDKGRDWVLSGSSAAAFRRGAATFRRPS